MDYASLKTEINTGPLAAECVGKSDAEIADLLNAKTVTTQGLVALSDIEVCLRAHGCWKGLKLAAADSQAAGHDLAWELVDIITASRLSNLDTSLPLVQGLAAGLVTAGLVPQTCIDAVMAMGIKSLSRADIAGLGTVLPDDITWIRR